MAEPPTPTPAPAAGLEKTSPVAPAASSFLDVTAAGGVRTGTGPSSSSSSKEKTSILSGDQQTQLNAFRARLHTSTDPAVKKAMADERFADDGYLWKFVAARQGNLDKAVAMITAHFQWRVKVQCDQVVAQHRAGKLFDPETIKKLKKCYPHGYCGVDRQGYPVYYERVGQVNVTKLLALMETEEAFLKYFMAEAETTQWVRMPAARQYAEDRMIEGAEQISKGVSVLDVSGIGMGFLGKTTRSVIAQISGMMSDNYPESAKTIVIVNSSRIATMIWPAVRSFINPDTAKKIKLVSRASTFSTLEKLIEPEWIPSWIPGGKCTLCGDTMERDVGPWVGEELWLEMERKIFPNGVPAKKPVQEPALRGRAASRETPKRSLSKGLLKSMKSAGSAVGRTLKMRPSSQERTTSKERSLKKSASAGSSVLSRQNSQTTDGGLEAASTSQGQGQVIHIDELDESCALGVVGDESEGGSGRGAKEVSFFRPTAMMAGRASRSGGGDVGAALLVSDEGVQKQDTGATAATASTSAPTASPALRTLNSDPGSLRATAPADLLQVDNLASMDQIQIDVANTPMSTTERFFTARSTGTAFQSEALNGASQSPLVAGNAAPYGYGGRGATPNLASTAEGEENAGAADGGGDGGLCCCCGGSAKKKQKS